jgi:5-oxoprolinase (ATP-hydrolysing)
MPPNSQSLAEEGASIKSFKLVKQGLFQEDGITEYLMSPAKQPGCSGLQGLFYKEVLFVGSQLSFRHT